MQHEHCSPLERWKRDSSGEHGVSLGRREARGARWPRACQSRRMSGALSDTATVVAQTPPFPVCTQKPSPDYSAYDAPPHLPASLRRSDAVEGVPVVVPAVALQGPVQQINHQSKEDAPERPREGLHRDDAVALDAERSGEVWSSVAVAGAHGRGPVQRAGANDPHHSSSKPAACQRSIRATRGHLTRRGDPIRGTHELMNRTTMARKGGSQ